MSSLPLAAYSIPQGRRSSPGCGRGRLGKLGSTRFSEAEGIFQRAAGFVRGLPVPVIVQATGAADVHKRGSARSAGITTTGTRGSGLPVVPAGIPDKNADAAFGFPPITQRGRDLGVRFKSTVLEVRPRERNFCLNL